MTGLPEGAASLPRVRDLIERGRSAERESRHEQARLLYEAALQERPSSGSAATASALLRWIARTHTVDPWAALDVLEVAQAVADASGDPLAVASAINSRAGVHFRLGELDEAEGLFRKARELAGCAGIDDLVAMVEQNLANIASIRGDLRLALVQFRSSLAGYRRLELRDYVGPLLNNIGRVHIELGEWDAAERALDEARRCCREERDRIHEVLVEVSRTRLCVERGEYQRAEEVCTQALGLARAAGEERWTAEIWRNLGVIRRAVGDLGEAATFLENARELAEGRGDMVVVADVIREQAALFRSMGKNPETLRALNEAHRLFEQLRARRELLDVDRRLRELEEEFLAIVRDWGRSLERKDSYTQGHCDRVAEYACRLAALAGMPPEEVKWFRMGAFLHDVGKVSVPRSILKKPGPLTEEERKVIEGHPVKGVELLEGIEFPWDVRPMIRHHHERWDGAGYPDGLKGREIPRAARILSVADVYDALTTTRSYRSAFAPEEAWEILVSESGRTLDPELVLLFRAVIRSERPAPAEADADTEREIPWLPESVPGESERVRAAV